MNHTVTRENSSLRPTAPHVPTAGATRTPTGLQVLTRGLCFQKTPSHFFEYMCFNHSDVFRPLDVRLPMECVVSCVVHNCSVCRAHILEPLPELFFFSSSLDVMITLSLPSKRVASELPRALLHLPVATLPPRQLLPLPCGAQLFS